MNPKPLSIHNLEQIGFEIQGVAQTLRAFCTSELAEGLEMSMDMLAENADRAAADIARFVEEQTVARRLAGRGAS
jgi:hypothetical protein